jgi:hypothetical protein
MSEGGSTERSGGWMGDAEQPLCGVERSGTEPESLD